METAAVGVGDRVAGRRLEQLLGRGGEGEVWRAAADDGAVWALKLLRPDLLPSPEEVRRRGAWLVDIDHPSLVAVNRGGRFTTGVLRDWGFVEMELVAGPSLALAPPMPDALPRLAGLAEALDLLHAGAWSEGVPLIHRDIKPGNLIEAPGGLVLVDPSTMRGLDTRDLTRIGTPAYLAPEVVTGRFGPLADVYSLAATAAALLTGRRGHDLAALLTRPDGLPPGVAAALAEDPGRRPGTCAAVLDDTERLAPGVPAPTPQEDVASGHVPAHPAAEPTAGPTAPHGPRWSLPALAAVVLVPTLAWAAGPSGGAILTGSQTRAVLLGAAAVHVLVHALRGRIVQAVLAAPWAWGDLLAGLAPGAPRRARWLADTTAGLLLACGLAAAVVSGLGDAPISGAEAWPLAAMAAVAASGAAVAAARSRSRALHLLGWVLLSPAWLVGAVLRALAGGRLRSGRRHRRR